MKAKFIYEALSIGPDGTPRGQMGLEAADIMQVISNSQDTKLSPQDFSGFIDFFLEIPNPQLANDLLWELVNFHPYIAEEIMTGEGQYRDEVDRFLSFIGDSQRRQSPFPPMSMN